PPADRADTAEKPRLPEPGRGAQPPALLDVAVHVAGSDSGVDHYVATFRLLASPGEMPFRFKLAEPAQLVGVSLSARRVAPLESGREYIVAPLPEEPPRQETSGSETVAVEYRLPAKMHWGPNSRPLLLPEPDCRVLGTRLDLVLPRDVRLSGP